MTSHQTFIDPGAGTWLKIDFLPGVELLPLAQPVPDGSIHRARLAAGTIIPAQPTPPMNLCSCSRAQLKPVEGAARPGHSGRRRLRPVRGRTLQSPMSSCLRYGSARWGLSAK
jgi:hypothetical protein